ncbi:MAG: hypothetical protein MJ108_06430 [Saccharofermentans sp.]|nr:hypothetical protein [Saccharofermentans sp.]
MDAFIKEVAAIADRVKAEKGSDKTVNLSFDEWNVWFHSNDADKEIAPWQVAPPLLEDIYNLEDALVVGCLLITLLKNSDRVKIACLAQLVNVIAPIMTENATDGGRVWKQTIYYPYMLVSKFGRGEAVAVDLSCDSYHVESLGDVPYIESVAVRSGEYINVFVVNRSLDEDCTVDFNCTGSVIEHIVVTSESVNDINTADAETVRPVNVEIGDEIVLSAKSFNVIRIKM